MRTYSVTISGDAIVSATVKIQAGSPEEAQRKALAMKEEDLTWDFGMLHEQVSDCGSVVYLNGKEVL